MGVKVRETTPESRMAEQMVTANSLKSRPTTPPMNRTGKNTAAREMVMDTMVKKISFDPSMAAGGGLALSMWRTMFSSMTIASSPRTHGQRQGHERDVI